MTWFGRGDVKPAPGVPLPPTDAPDVEPRALPPMSPKRARAIAKAISEGKARTIPHALFLHAAGVLDLPA